MSVYIKRAIAHRRRSSSVERSKQNQCSCSLSPESPTRRHGRPKASTKSKLPVCRSAFAPISVMLNVFLVPMHLYKVFFVCEFPGLLHVRFFRLSSCVFLLCASSSFLSLFRVQVQGHLVFFWRKHARQVELDVLVHKEGHAGRWQDPNEVWSQSVIALLSVQSYSIQTAVRTLCRIPTSPRTSLLA